MAIRPKTNQQHLLKTYTYSTRKTPLGFIAVTRTLLGISTFILPKKTEEEVRSMIRERIGDDAAEDNGGFELFYRKMLDYFMGKNVRFDELLDMGEASNFEKRVWMVAATIPWGQVRSYDWVANSIGQPRSWRAVGQALSRNRIPILIPCHRVIMKSGDIGGFVEGPEMKRLLLKIEGRVL